jgi:hypothetical protein
MKNRQKVIAFAKERWNRDWSFFNAYGKLRIILECELAGRRSLGEHDPVYRAVRAHVERISAVEVTKIIKSERQIARHAMIIKLTRL